LCWARRLSRRVLDCRFLGTAIERRRIAAVRRLAGNSATVFVAAAYGEAVLLELQVTQLRHPRVAALRVAMLLGIGVVERLAADRAEPGAIRPAEGL